MKSFLKITLAIIVAMCVLIGGCVAVIGGAASSASKEMDKEQNAHAITKAQLASAKMGDSKAEVESLLGEPDDSQHSESSSEFGDSTSDCIYYNVKGGGFMDSYQLCFENDRLRSKNQW